MALIEADGLGVRYGGAEVLRDVSLRITQGEIVTVVGPNGSGKSTLLRALLGLIGPAGRISGRVVRQPGLRVGYVPQRLHVDAALPMPVWRFLSLPTRRSRAAIAAALDRVGVPGTETRQMTALSGGQFQRVLLARALLADPDVLILDEPTQGLDQPGVAAFYQLLDAVRRERGCAVLLVGHDLHVVMSAADRVICLNGHVCCEGAPHVVSNAPEYRALFGLGTGGALALYPHVHDHSHDGPHDHGDGHAGQHEEQPGPADGRRIGAGAG